MKTKNYIMFLFYVAFLFFLTTLAQVEYEKGTPAPPSIHHRMRMRASDKL
ncbi:MAG: hypothetical protein KDD51_11665 [Bdellovibrionales bacterium]|nr:hypothetical protein [Bdellovibrionales bacterium]